ncbi:site-specific DNA-methyltransferase [Aquiluna sp. Uisw_065]|uniref:site-specific DNA-methyltransferase n=1 Tax=Aquiluna sp. Uisw_065 TaxID=3230967 RepID=UPI0039ED08BB
MNDDIYETSATTPNFQTALGAQLADLIPEAIADGKVDVAKLQELLSTDAADPTERFGLFWPGKKRALRASQEPTTATLKPDFENSKNWDNTKNVFIEGDNLEVLKILQKHYHAKIKMIYIDPPYNTGKDFVYPDNFREGLDTYLEWTRQVNEEGKKVSTNADTEGRYHSNWLNMMYPRLKLARNLLMADGAIFISIDDSELDNLKRMANEVFGENNFVGTMIWAAGRKNDSKYISSSHEYILCFARNLGYLKESGVDWKVRKKGLDVIYKEAEHQVRIHSGDLEAASAGLKTWFRTLPDNDEAKRNSHYSRIDPRGVYFADNISWPGGGGPKYEVLHPLTGRPVRIPSRGWLFQPDTMKKHIDADQVLFGADENAVPTFKRYLKDTEYEAPYSVFYQDGRAATKRLRTLMGEKVFDYPKDELVLQSLAEMVTSDEDIVLDFFAGSGTTAHAVMALNADDGCSRRFIQVQLPEPTPGDSDARKAGFKTIADISRRRISLAAQEIAQAQATQLSTREVPLDLGFRAYKLGDTNFSKWRVTSDVEADALQHRLLGLRDSSSGDEATPDDLLTEILLKQGYSLTEKISPTEIAGLDLRSVRQPDGDVAVLAHLDEHVKPTLEQLRAIVDADPSRIVILEDAFQGDDELKTNLVQLAKSRDIELWTA